MRIVFAVMSAQQSPCIVSQLADTLAPHQVVIHHDFKKLADFRVDRPNVRFVPNPKLTGWGNWGFTEGIFHTIDYCVKNVEFDYFQLLSPTCLPIRPVSEFEAYLRNSPDDVHGDFLPIDRSDDILMSFAFRTFVRQDSLFYRPMRRAQRWYFGPDMKVEQMNSLSVRRRLSSYQGMLADIKAKAGLAFTKLAVSGLLGKHPFGPSLRPQVGSTWVGLKPAACRYLLAQRSNPVLQDYFQHLAIVDETLFPTLLTNSGLRVGSGNHVINTFTEKGNPAWIDDSDIPRIAESDRFFARKFPDDVAAKVRAYALRRVGAKDQAVATPG